MGEFRMPSLGADMVSGTLVEWRVHPGEVVRRGDIVAVVDTDKAAIEVEVWEGGVVEEILVSEGTRVPVGTVLARLGPANEGAAAPEPAPAPVAVPPVEPASRAPAQSPSEAAVPGPPPLRPPGVRARLPRRGVWRRSAGSTSRSCAGTGPDGAVVRADVERPQAPPPAHRPRVSPVAAKMAVEMGIDLATVTGTGAGGAITKADVASAAAARARPASTEAVAPGAAAAKARSAAMREAIAAAVAKSKREIPHYYLWTHVDLRRALEWLEAGNAKRSGVEGVLGVIYPPQVAIVGFGKIVERLWAEDGMVGVRPVVGLTLAADHRASDGHRGSLFPETIAELLQKPEEL